MTQRVAPARRVIPLLAWAALAAIAAPAACGSSNADNPPAGSPDGGVAGGGGAGGADAPGKCVTSTCLKGNVCVDGACSLPCASHADCPMEDGWACREGVADDDGKKILACKKGSTPKAQGGYGWPCGINLDADCDAAAGFSCAGRAAEVDAFCTKYGGCKEDKDCPADMWCGNVRRPACIGGKDCTSDATCDTGAGYTCQPALSGKKRCILEKSCHTNPDDCDPATTCSIPPGSGTVYKLVRACIPRRYCAPCAQDFDCVEQNGVCVEIGGGKFCSVKCAADSNTCDPGSECKTLGGVDACVPRGGSCKGNATQCSFCRDDSECSATGICYVFTSTRERFCLEPCSGGTCPKTPGGGPQQCCADAAQCGLLLDHCIPKQYPLPYPASAWGCWLKACSKNSECQSGWLCDVRDQAQTGPAEITTKCALQGICRPVREKSDPYDYKAYGKVCDCKGGSYASEAALAANPDAQFKGCCKTIVVGSVTYACAP